MITSKAQIVATIGPASSDPVTLRTMIQHHMDVARLNLAWGTFEEHAKQIEIIRGIQKEVGREIPILIDMPGPRIQDGAGHSYEEGALSVITERDREIIKFAVKEKADYVGISYIGSAADVELCRKLIKEAGGKQRIIAKIERMVAVGNLDSIIKAADAVMVARGDLGDAMPIERLPFVQHDIVQACKKAGKPVIVATEMLLSMVNKARPTRAEVTDVANALLQGADATMLSEESAKGKYPVEAVMIMERILVESEKHLIAESKFNHLVTI